MNIEPITPAVSSDPDYRRRHHLLPGSAQAPRVRAAQIVPVNDSLLVDGPIASGRRRKERR